MSQTRSLLLKIAAENSLPVPRIEEMIKKLEEEWYTEVVSLREITEEQWKTFGFPARIVGLIKKSISESPEVLLKSRESVLSSIIQLFPQSSPDLLNCISVLRQIIFNLLHFPQENKYKTIKQNNPKFLQAVGRFALCQEYLRIIGFQPIGEDLRMMQNSENTLKSALEELNVIGESIGLAPLVEPEKFNPFRASISCTNFAAPKMVGGENDPIAITEEIMKIKRMRAEALKKVQIQRNLRVFRGNDRGGTLANEGEESMKELDEEIMRKNIKNVLEQRESSMSFKNKRKNELEKLKSREFLAKVTIRIRFPDQYFLEGNFAVTETVRDVYAFVQSSLAFPHKFYLFSSPPKQILKVSEEKLVNYTPAAVFQFSWTENIESGSYLKPSLINN